MLRQVESGYFWIGQICTDSARLCQDMSVYFRLSETNTIYFRLGQVRSC